MARPQAVLPTNRSRQRFPLPQPQTQRSTAVHRPSGPPELGRHAFRRCEHPHFTDLAALQPRYVRPFGPRVGTSRVPNTIHLHGRRRVARLWSHRVVLPHPTSRHSGAHRHHTPALPAVKRRRHRLPVRLRSGPDSLPRYSRRFRMGRYSPRRQPLIAC